MSSSLYDKDMVWPETVIVGNGDFPSSGIPLGILRRARYVCCCDGAVEQVVSHGIIPDAIAGDGDSLSAEMRERFNGIIHLFDEQDDNDQTKATRFCAANGIRSIAYIGSTGRREDHTLGNISLLTRYMSEFGIEPVMVTDYGYFVPARGRMEFQSFRGQQVSVFNFGTKDMSSTGLKWDVYPFSSWWQGTLNEALGDSFTICSDGDYIVFRTFEGK